MFYVEPEMVIIEFDEKVATDIPIASGPAGEGNDDTMGVEI